MRARKTLTLNLTEAEMAGLEVLCGRYEMNKTAVLRKALRMFSMIDARIERGEKLFAEDEKEQKKAELVML
jgi:hypothetical protein